MSKLKVIQKIEVVVTEDDLECFKDVVYHNNSMIWQYNLENGEPVDIEFVSEDESSQRGQ